MRVPYGLTSAELKRKEKKKPGGHHPPPPSSSTLASCWASYCWACPAPLWPPLISSPFASHEWAFHQSYILSPHFLSLPLSVSLFHSAGGLLLPAHRGSSDYVQRRRSRGGSKRKLYAVRVAVKVWWRNCCAEKSNQQRVKKGKSV